LELSIPNPDKPVGTKWKSRFIGEPKISLAKTQRTQRIIIWFLWLTFARSAALLEQNNIQIRISRLA